MKSLYTSKTFLVNVLTLVVSVASGQVGIDIPPQVSVPLLAAANILLRILTKVPVKVL